MRQITESEATFAVECLPEDIPVRGNALASGDAAEDKQAEDEIVAAVNAGDAWAWCAVRVVARWNGFEGSDYLGGCSYKSEADFREPGGYFDDMKTEALANLNAAIADVAKRLPDAPDTSERETIALARSVIRDQAFGYPERDLAASPVNVCDALSALLGETYDFATGEVK